MAEQYYDVKARKVYTIQERIGGDVVFDHGRISDLLFQDKLNRGELVPYRQEAKKSKKGIHHEQPLTQALATSAATAFIFSKLFDRDRAPRLEMKQQIKLSIDAEARGRLDRFLIQHNERSNRVVFRAMEMSRMKMHLFDYAAAQGAPLTFTGSNWTGDVFGAYKYIKGKAPDLDTKIDDFFVNVVESQHERLTGEKARPSFARAVLKTGIGMPANAGIKDIQDALSPLMRERIELRQRYHEILNAKEEADKIAGDLLDAESRLKAAQDLAEQDHLERLEALRQRKSYAQLSHTTRKGLAPSQLIHNQRQRIAELKDRQARIMGILQRSDGGKAFAAERDAVKAYLDAIDQNVSSIINTQGIADMEFVQKLNRFERLVSDVRFGYGDASDRALQELYSDQDFKNRLMRVDKGMYDELEQRWIELSRSVLAMERSAGGERTIRKQKLDGWKQAGARELNVFEYEEALQEQIDQFKAETERVLSDDPFRRRATMGSAERIGYNPDVLGDKTNYSPLNERIGKTYLDPKTGKSYLVAGRAGDQYLRIGMDPPVAGGLDLDATLKSPELVRESVRLNLDTLMGTEMDDVRRQAVQDLRDVLLDSNRGQRIVETRRQLLRKANAGGKSIPLDINDQALVDVFQDISKRIGLGHDLKGLLSQAAPEAEIPGIRFGAELKTALYEGMGQIVAGRQGARDGAEAMLRIITRTRYTKDGGFSTLIANQAMPTRFGKIFEAAIQSDDKLFDQLASRVSEIHGAARLGASDQAVLQSIKGYLGSTFRSKDKELAEAFFNPNYGDDLTRDFIRRLTDVRTDSLNDGIPGFEELTREGAIAGQNRFSANPADLLEAAEAEARVRRGRYDYQAPITDLDARRAEYREALLGDKSKLQQKVQQYNRYLLAREEDLKARSPKSLGRNAYRNKLERKWRETQNPKKREKIERRLAAMDARPGWFYSDPLDSSFADRAGERRSRLVSNVERIDQKLIREAEWDAELLSVKERKTISNYRRALEREEDQLSRRLGVETERMRRRRLRRDPHDLRKHLRQIRADRSVIERIYPESLRRDWENPLRGRFDRAILKRDSDARKIADRLYLPDYGVSEHTRLTWYQQEAEGLERAFLARQTALEAMQQNAGFFDDESFDALQRRYARIGRARVNHRLRYNARGYATNVPKRVTAGRGMAIAWTGSYQELGSIVSANKAVRAEQRAVADLGVRLRGAQKKLIDQAQLIETLESKLSATSASLASVEQDFGTAQGLQRQLMATNTEEYLRALMPDPETGVFDEGGKLTEYGQALRQALVKDPTKIEAMLRGDMSFFSPRNQDIVEAGLGTPSKTKRFSYLRGFGRGDMYLKNNPLGSFIMGSTAEASLRMTDSTTTGRAFVLDIESAGSTTTRQSFLSPIVTEFAYMEDDIANLRAAASVQGNLDAILEKSKVGGFATLDANKAVSVYIQPTQEAEEFMLKMAERQDAGQRMSKAEREQLNFLKKRYAVVGSGDQRRVGILGVSADDRETLKALGGHNVIADARGNLTYVKHVQGRVGMVETVSGLDRATHQAIQKQAGVVKGKLSVPILTFDQFIEGTQRFKGLRTLMQDIASNADGVLIGNNLLRHDLPVLLSLMHKDSSYMADPEKVVSALGRTAYFDISAAMRGLGYESGSVERASRVFGVSFKQMHDALRDVLQESLAAFRAASKIAETGAVRTLTAGESMLFDRRTGQVLRVQNIETGPQGLSRIFGTEITSATQTQRSIASETFSVEDVSELKAGVGNGTEPRTRREIRPAMYTLSERYEVLNSLDDLTDAQKRQAIHFETLRLMDPAHLRRSLDAPPRVMPEFMAPVRDMLDFLRKASQQAGVSDELLGSALRAFTTADEEVFYKLPGPPRRYMPFISEKLEKTLGFLVGSDAKPVQEILSAVSESKPIKGALLTMLQNYQPVNKNGFDAQVRNALLSSRPAEMLRQIEGRHFLSANEYNLPEFSLPMGLEKATAADLQAAMLRADSEHPNSRNILRDALLDDRKRLMREIVREEIESLILRDKAKTGLSAELDDAERAALDAFDRMYGRIEKQYVRIAEKSHEAMKPRLQAEMELEGLEVTDDSMREFMRRRASSSVRSSQLNEELERLKNVGSRDFALMQDAQIMRYFSETGSVTENNLDRVKPLITQDAVRKNLFAPAQASSDELLRFVSDANRLLGSETSGLLGRSVFMPASNLRNATMDYLATLPENAAVRISTSSAASPGFQDELVSLARQIERSKGKGSASWKALQSNVMSALTPMGEKVVALKETAKLEDVIGGMTEAQLQRVYEARMAGQAKVFDASNRFLGHVPASEIPSVEAGEAVLGRVQRASSGGLLLNVGSANVGVGPSVSETLDRVAEAIDGTMRPSAAAGAQSLFGEVLPLSDRHASLMDDAILSANEAREAAVSSAARESILQEVAEGQGKSVKEAKVLMNKRHLKWVIGLGAVAAGVLGYSFLNRPEIQDNPNDYLPSNEVMPPPETFYAHQAETFKDYRKDRAKDLARAERKSYELQPRPVGMNYRIKIDAEHEGADYQSEAAEGVVREVLQRNVSQPLSVNAQRDDQRRAIYTSTYQSAMRSYLDR